VGSPTEPGRGRVARCCLHAARIALAATAAFLTLAATALASCPGAGEIPTATNIARVERATLCLVNQERRRHGLHTLRMNRRLVAAGRYHARDMIRRGYFAHTSPSGDTVESRIRKAGYMIPRLHWIVGENLGWGRGPDATPARMMYGWMHSPEHRANILYPPFRQAGIFIGLGVPVPGLSQASGSATFANEFGVRR
jgi:uncharacterized protein YkwD